MASLEDAEKALQDECHRLASELHALKSDTELTTPQVYTTCPDDIRKQNLKRLELELKLLEHTPPREPIPNTLVVADHLLKKLDKDIEESQKYAEISKESLEKLKSEVEYKTKFLREQQEIAKQLEEDLQKSEDQPHPIKEAIKRTEKRHDEYLSKLFVFLDKHFPAKDGFVSMRNIAERLLKPENRNSYIEIEKDFWPPDVELLLRWSLCSRHPDNPSLIKLFYNGE